VGFSFVRRCVSSPEIIPIKPRRTVAVPWSVSIARAAMHRHSKAHADPLCPTKEGATHTPIRCIDWQETVSLLQEERLLERPGPTSLRTQSPEE